MDVKTFCLGLLMQQEATGYEIQKAVKDGRFHIFFEASFGSIYPALSRLMDEGLVSCKEHPQDGRPDKKVYHITESGREAFLNALLEPVGEDRFRSDFMARIFFSKDLPRVRLKRLLDDRVAFHRAEIAVLDGLQNEQNSSTAEGFLMRLARLYNQMSIDFIVENRGELERSTGQTEAAE